MGAEDFWHLPTKIVFIALEDFISLVNDPYLMPTSQHLIGLADDRLGADLGLIQDGGFGIALDRFSLEENLSGSGHVGFWTDR